MRNKACVVLVIILSLAALATVLIMGSCSGSIETAAGGSVPMKCHWSMRVCMMLLMASVFFGVMQFLLKEKSARLLSAASVVILTIFQLLTCSSIVIGVCAKAGMQCRNTVGVLRVLWFMIITVELIAVLMETHKQHPSKMF